MRSRQDRVRVEGRLGGSGGDVVVRHPGHRRALAFVGHVNKRMRRRGVRRLALHIPDINRGLTTRNRSVRRKTITANTGDAIVN